MCKALQLVKPVGVVKIKAPKKVRKEQCWSDQGECYRVQKKVFGIVHHICTTKNIAVGMIAFDVYSRRLGLSIKMSLNFPELQLEGLQETLNFLDPKVYEKVIQRADQWAANETRKAGVITRAVARAALRVAGATTTKRKNEL